MKAWMAVIGFVITLLGGVSYKWLVDVPWIRVTAAPCLAIMVIGIALCIAAVVQKHSVLNISLAVVSVLMIGLFVSGIFIFSGLPKAGALADGRPAPNFELPDHEGRVFSLADFRGAPVLLVFYRGYW